MTHLIRDWACSAGRSGVMRAAGVLTRLVPITPPILLVGPGASARLGQTVARFGHEKILLVIDSQVARLGLQHALTQALTQGGTPWLMFDDVSPDAPIAQIDKGIAIFQAAGCDAIIAMGGGSAIDVAKTIGLSVANRTAPHQLVGYFRAWHAPVPLYAVPTTAGTGSEVSVVAVISDPETHQKLQITDTRLVPGMAALDPCLMTGLPPDVSAATGMDALTHAIEAYLGHWSTRDTDRMALAAVGLIYDNLRTVCHQGQDLAAREKMALASTYAGLAFTRASVGYVHAIAHQLGALYHTPHGLANAIMLAHVLRFYGSAIENKLAVLAVHVRLGRAEEPTARLAHKFVASIDALNADLGLPRQLDALRKADIAPLAKAACHEADTHYPVPRYMSMQTCQTLLRRALPRTTTRQRATKT